MAGFGHLEDGAARVLRHRAAGCGRPGLIADVIRRRHGAMPGTAAVLADIGTGAGDR